MKIQQTREIRYLFHIRKSGIVSCYTKKCKFGWYLNFTLIIQKFIALLEIKHSHILINIHNTIV